MTDRERRHEPDPGPGHEHPFDTASSHDHSDLADPRVVQPGDDPIGEDAMRPIGERPSGPDEDASE